jgi:hypothetical protein
MLLAAVYILACGFSIVNYRHLPLIDFRPYSVGTEIREGMEIPEGASSDEYETTLTYRNRSTGKVEKFSMDDYPRDSSQWIFVTSESRLVRKGYEPTIHDFALMDAYGNDMVDRILEDPGYSLLMISHDLSAADESCLYRAGEWARIELLADDFSFYAVSSSTTSETQAISNSLGLQYPFYAADEIMLKTIVRSNPGFLLIHRGAIAGKWACRDFPAPDELDPDLRELLDNASAPVDEETQMLMEAGLVEAFSFDVLDFESLVPRLIYQKEAQSREGGVVLAFILAVCLLIVGSSLIEPVKI